MTRVEGGSKRIQGRFMRAATGGRPYMKKATGAVAYFRWQAGQ
jgi:hypothetical protein